MTSKPGGAPAGRDPGGHEGAVTGANRYVIPKHVRFGHCDPAGIVYYPRYFELLHDAKEDFFREALGLPFLELIGRQRLGFPIVRMEADFMAPSRLGEVIEIAVSVGRIGRSSLELDYECECAGQQRMRAHTTVVHTRLDEGVAAAISDALRGRLERFVAGSLP